MKVGLRPEQQVDRDTMTGKKKKKKGLQTFDFRGNTASKYIIYFLLLI
jgi:hypothetical protein